MRPLIAEGLVDVAQFDAEQPGPLHLLESGRTLATGSLSGPTVGIANYVFDSLRNDCYLVRGGELFENHVAVATSDTKADRPDEVATADLWLQWEAAPLSTPPGDVRRVLEHYADHLDDTAVLVPTTAMACLTFLQSLSTGPSLALVADKGHDCLRDLCGQTTPSIVTHGEAFSLMVNFDFLSRWSEHRGDAAMLPPGPARSLVVAAFAHGLDDVETATFRATYDDELATGGPDGFFTLRPLFGSAAADASIDGCLAALAHARWDPSVFLDHLPALLDELPGLDDTRRPEVDRALRNVWDAWFPIGEQADVALCIGLAYSAMTYYHESIRFLERSIAEHGASAESALAVALAHYGRRDLEAAEEWVGKALAIEPGFGAARTLRLTLDEAAVDSSDDVYDSDVDTDR
jgi:hypothetical protein